MPDYLCDAIALEVLERDSLDLRLTLARYPRAELDDPIIADIDAVMVVGKWVPSADLEMITGLDPTVHVDGDYREPPTLHGTTGTAAMLSSLPAIPARDRRDSEGAVCCGMR